MIIVHKYGGSSVATTEKILDIAKYLGEVKDNKNDVVVVVSAMGKRTDALISLAKEITDKGYLKHLQVAFCFMISMPVRWQFVVQRFHVVAPVLPLAR